MPSHSSLAQHACYPGLEGGGEEAYGLGGGGGGGGGYDGYGLGAVPGYNVVFNPGEPGEPTTLTSPVSLALMTVGGAVAGGVVTKSWWGAVALGVLGYLAGAGLRATTGLKA